MRHARWIFGLGTVTLIFTLVLGCISGPKKEGKMARHPFGGQEDMSRAGDLWNTMKDYRSWKSYPGLDGWQDGMSPHGDFQKYYINNIAASNTTSPRDRSIIIKENYGAKDDTKLGSITVMKKLYGYDPENKDWFWVKFDPKGNVMKNPKNMHLAGRVAKGMSKGCISCHSNADGGDYLFIND